MNFVIAANISGLREWQWYFLKVLDCQMLPVEKSKRRGKILHCRISE